MSSKSKNCAIILSSLEKVFLDKEPIFKPECSKFTMLLNETISFQVAYQIDCLITEWAFVKINSPINEFITVRDVVNVPCSFPTSLDTDGGYLRTKPGMYPDLLTPLKNGNIITVSQGNWKSIWIDVEMPADGTAGKFPISISFFGIDNKELFSVSTNVTVINAVLPSQKLKRSEWFHGDCLAIYYKVDVFSEEHWRIMEGFLKIAVKRSINTILTPHFTPPLDTAKGGERKTIQLVDVFIKDGQYSFGFDKLKRWIDMCTRIGIKYFEMSHLFTQWGGQSAPKIIAQGTEGAQTQIFGWDTPSLGAEYTEFLSVYLPQLTRLLKELGLQDKTYFHISDEPEKIHLDDYVKLHKYVSKFIQGFKTMDALSDFELYQRGAVDIPVCATDCIEPFLENKVAPLWSYYCTAQFLDVSNRFIAMPSSRNRIYATQIYKYGLDGILHWGYNFYNSKHSIYPINPYLTTDAGGTFPSGDPFLVYPGEDGIPEESIRMMILYHAMCDIRAMELLESLTNRQYVLNLLEHQLSDPITFKVYPRSDTYILQLRNTINQEIYAHQ